MKKQFIVANWKSHKNLAETQEWLEEFSIINHQFSVINKPEIILCPPFPLLSFCQEFINKHHLSLELGSQTISSYPEGTYTGEVAGRLLKDFVTYTLIGHSERRRLFHESENEIVEKVKMAQINQIKPILLVSDINSFIPQGVDSVVYEPPSAISSDKGLHPENPADVESVASFLKQKNGVLYVLYGGSVTQDNVEEYTRLPSINGVIVGGESLHPQSFATIIQHA